LVVVGAVLVSYLASGRSGAQQAAYAEMNENAQLGLGLLSRDLLLAGYAQPTGYQMAGAPAVATGNLTRTYEGRPVFGCDNGFVSPSTTGAVACAITAGAPAIEMVYEADVKNTVPTAANVPSDCLGNTLNPATGTLSGTDYFVVFNRYYVATIGTGRSELHCASNTQDVSGQPVPGQPLVDNVEAMKFWYGEAGATPDHRQVVRYVTAGNLADASFAKVIAVKVCLLVRSSEAVLDAGETADTATNTAMLTYLDCDSAAQTSVDRYLRRAYFTTVTLRNKMAF
jgi:type IV pilus assembly protein PilW